MRIKILIASRPGLIKIQAIIDKFCIVKPGLPDTFPCGIMLKAKFYAIIIAYKYLLDKSSM